MINIQLIIFSRLLKKHTCSAMNTCRRDAALSRKNRDENEINVYTIIQNIITYFNFCVGSYLSYFLLFIPGFEEFVAWGWRGN